MALIDVVNEANDMTFQAKCRQKFYESAVAVGSEDPETANHDNRLKVAQKIIYGELTGLQMAMSVLTNATIQAHITASTDYDSDLAFVCNSLITPMANALSVTI